MPIHPGAGATSLNPGELLRQVRDGLLLRTLMLGLLTPALGAARQFSAASQHGTPARLRGLYGLLDRIRAADSAAELDAIEADFDHVVEAALRPPER